MSKRIQQKESSIENQESNLEPGTSNPYLVTQLVRNEDGSHTSEAKDEEEVKKALEEQAHAHAAIEVRRLISDLGHLTSDVHEPENQSPETNKE